MKVRVTNSFIDKETKEYHKAGKETVIDISKARYDEISAAGKYVEVVEEGTKEAIRTDAKEAQEEERNEAERALDDMTLAELKEYASNHDIDLNGARTKATIIEAIKGDTK